MSHNQKLNELAQQVITICSDPHVKSYKPALNNNKNQNSIRSIVSKIYIRDRYASINGIQISQNLKNACCLYSKMHDNNKDIIKSLMEKNNALKKRLELFRDKDHETFMCITEEIAKNQTEIDKIKLSSETNKGTIAMRALKRLADDENDNANTFFNMIYNILNPVVQQARQPEKYKSDYSRYEPVRENYVSEKYVSEKDIQHAKQLLSEGKFVPPHMRKYLNLTPAKPENSTKAQQPVNVDELFPVLLDKKVPVVSETAQLTWSSFDKQKFKEMPAPKPEKKESAPDIKTVKNIKNVKITKSIKNTKSIDIEYDDYNSDENEYDEYTDCTSPDIISNDYSYGYSNDASPDNWDDEPYNT